MHTPLILESAVRRRGRLCRLFATLMLPFLMSSTLVVSTHAQTSRSATQQDSEEGTPKDTGRKASSPRAPVFVLYREPIEGLTTTRYEVKSGELIPLTLHSTLQLTISRVGNAGGPLPYQWTGARPIIGNGMGSTAEFVGRRPGLYTIKVKPDLPGSSEFEVRAQVFPIRPERIDVRISDPPGQVTYVGKPFTCQCATVPPEFESLVEWNAPMHTVRHGVGPHFRTSREVIGDQYPIFAGLASTKNPPSARMMVYEATWVKQPSIADYFVAPTVHLHFQVATNPPGYEDRVHWMFDSMDTADVFPTMGQGAVFEPVVTPHKPGTLWRMVEADNLDVSGDPFSPEVPTPFMGLWEQLPTQPGDKRGDYLRSFQPVGSAPPFSEPVFGAVIEQGLASPASPAPCPVPERLPLDEMGHPGAVATDPITTGAFNGEARVQETFLRVDSRGFPFEWICTYSSRADFDSATGRNWACNYNDRRVFVIPGGSGNVSLVDGLGREDTYLSIGGGAFTSPAGVFDKLVRNGDNTYTQVNASGVTFQYDVNGYLVSLADRAGNSMTFLRNGFNNVTQVTDTQGRVYTTGRSVSGGMERIDSISDFDARQVVFTRDGNGDLIRVQSPVVTGTPNGNDFSSGKTILYTYSTGSADSRLNHNLLAVFDPQYNVSNNPALSRAKDTFSYSSATDPNAADFDHVISVRHGNDQGSPTPGPFVVGGTLSFSYSRQLSGDPDAPAGAFSRTTETDANGNVKVYYFDVSRHLRRKIERTNRGVRPGEGDYTTNFTYTSEGLLASMTHPRGNAVEYLYDLNNPRILNRNDLLEVRLRANGVGGGGTDLVTRYTYDPVFNELRTTTDPRGFPTGAVPLDANGHLNLADATVARYTNTTLFDYQEGTGFQAAQGIVANERIPEGLGDLNLNSQTDTAQGNVVKLQHPNIQSGPNAGQSAAALRTSNSNGQPLTSRDPEGHTTLIEYFPHVGSANDPVDREGYLKAVTRDSGGLNLKTQYQYDQRGNPTTVIDPKNQNTIYVYNQLDQKVRRQSRIVFGTTRYQIDYFYTLNDDLDHVEIQNLDEAGAAFAHNPITKSASYNILHYPISKTLDKSLNDNSFVGTVTTQIFFDANLNRTAIKLPLAVSGSVPSNIVTTLFDERDLPYKVTTGDNDTNPANAPPASAVVVTRNYDPNRSLLETIDAIRNAQHAFAPTTSFPGSAAGDVTKQDYDGFDRLVKIMDGEGDEYATAYDFASNPIQETLRGPVDHLAATISLLTQTSLSLDERNRVFQEDSLHFVTKTGVNIGDGHRITQTKYDRDNKVTEVTDDRGLKTTTQWDSADRRLKKIDQLNNETEFGYDLNSNVISMIERDISTDLATGMQVYTTSYTLDGIDRRIKTIDPAGDVNDFFYDSRGNVVKISDGVRGAGQPSGPGNVIKRTYDALDRLVKTERVLTSNGKGDSGQVGIITTLQAWDDDSSLTSQTDDNNHAITYGYDALNRLTTITNADATNRTTQFDTDNHVTQWTDPNGSVVTMNTLTGYDGLNRLLARAVTPGAGVIGSTSETFAYDGDSRVTHTTNNDGITGTMTCDFEYDSLSNRTKDQQGALSVDSVYDAVSSRTQITYPGQFGGGRRVLTRTFDNLNRLQAISDPSGTIATMHYKGPGRLERRTYGTDGAPISKLDAGYDALPRIDIMDHTTGASSPIARFEYGYDRMSHRLYEKRVHDTSHGDVYRYDSIYRVIRNSQNIDLSAIPPGTEIDPDAYASASDRLAYAFDGVGNRTTSTKFVGGISTVTTYTQTPDGVVKDAEVNQYTSTQEDSLPVKNYTYDLNGNLTSDGSKKYAYDFKNRLVEVRDQATNNLIVQYSYDADDRRSMKMIAGGPTTDYLYDGPEDVEERDGSSAITRQYVWGPKLDELLQEKTASATYYAHENSIRSIAALTNAVGVVVERYQYDPFGTTTVTLDGATGNRFRFQGAYFDSETGFYFMRHRTLSPALGRFLQRDPVGIWTDRRNMGNGYSFPGSDGINLSDPLGLQGEGSGTSDGAPSDQPQAQDETDQLNQEMDQLNDEYYELVDEINAGGDTPEIEERLQEINARIIEILDRLDEIERERRATMTVFPRGGGSLAEAPLAPCEGIGGPPNTLAFLALAVIVIVLIPIGL